MSRKSNRRGSFQARPARGGLSLFRPASVAVSTSSHPARVRVGIRTVRPTLMRTVPGDTDLRSGTPQLQQQVRASLRSSPKMSPFLEAQGITPQLTRRAQECAKRSIRREVLFATRQTGKGAHSPRKPKSNWRC